MVLDVAPRVWSFISGGLGSREQTKCGMHRGRNLPCDGLGSGSRPVPFFEHIQLKTGQPGELGLIEEFSPLIRVEIRRLVQEGSNPELVPADGEKRVPEKESPGSSGEAPELQTKAWSNQRLEARAPFPLVFEHAVVQERADAPEADLLMAQFA